MSIAGRNAAASSSRVGVGMGESSSLHGKNNDRDVRDGSVRTRSVSRRREGLGRGRSVKSLGKDRDGAVELERAKSPNSDAGTSAVGGRKVRTVPPSARFDPPTPEPDDEPDNALTGMTSQNGTTMATNSTQPQAQPQAHTHAHRKRPRPKIRYSTSSESDGDSDDSDEEPPWWTFTQRGMMKMRARTLGVGRTKSPVEEAGSDVAIPNGQGYGHGHETGRSDDLGVGTGGDVEVPATAESGLDTRDKEKVAQRKVPGSRKSSREKKASRDGSTPSSSIRGQTRSGSPSRMPFLHSGFPHTALRFPAHFRSSPKGTPVALSLDTSPRGRMQRSNSAPGSPSVESTSPALPTIATLVSAAAVADPEHPVEILSEADDHPEPQEHESEHSQLDADHTGPVLPRTRQRPKRQATAPTFSFLKRLSDTGENLTDSEAAMFTSPRVRAKAKLSPTETVQALDRAEISESPLSQTPDGSATPTRPKARRRQTHRLRINLPPPITQHFANGWPHAGSWQDALYGHYDDVSTSSRHRYPTGTPGSRATPVGSGVVQSGRSSHEHFPSVTANRAVNGNGTGNGNVTGNSLPTSLAGSVPDPARPPFTPRASHDGSPASSPPPAEIERPKRTRTKRRRYRQALVPPTPQGLGFSPTDRDEGFQPAAWKEGRVGEHGFHWGTAGRAGLIEEGDELSRAETSGTVPMTMNEKGFSGKGRRRWWLFGPRDASKRRMIDEDWRKRWRRILFLDARVTIWIRLVNLAVAATLLGLALTIRFELIRLRLPGMMGSSTTLVIAYSSLTVFHVLTAIYREYFGKPIGLWGLRSKMLWVCLDLCFVAMWSSAVSLATNDYIATPLECTTASPWWRSGLSTDYAELLDDLQLLSSAGNSTVLQNSATDRVGVTPASLVAHSLGIILPAEIVESSLTREACRRQQATIALSMLALLLYGGNMVLSLFRIFETVRRTANVDRAVMV